MTATDRFKMLLANALERVCVLEEQLEQQRAELDRLRPTTNGRTDPISEEAAWPTPR
jgi:hypothetical protein